MADVDADVTDIMAATVDAAVPWLLPWRWLWMWWLWWMLWILLWWQRCDCFCAVASVVPWLFSWLRDTSPYALNATPARTSELVDHHFVPRDSLVHPRERAPPQPALTNSMVHALRGLSPRIASGVLGVPGAATVHRFSHCPHPQWSHTACCCGSARGTSHAGASNRWWHVATVRTELSTIVVAVMWQGHRLLVCCLILC